MGAIHGSAAPALAAITVLAAGLRLYDLARVGPGNLFYASAVRSMSGSWHNFFYAAFDPAATLSVDKPPLALWIQVASSALLGHGGVAVVLPMALAGVAAVPLVYGAARRSHGVAAGLAAALLLAVFPESVATARDSTMDALMMALCAAAAWMLVGVIEDERPWRLVGWAALMGIVFNVKFFEGLVMLPAALLYAGWRWRARWRERLAPVLVATAVGAVVAFAWVSAVELTPASDRPAVMNDRDNSAFGLVFRYNGLERVLPGRVVAFQPDPGSSAPSGNSLAFGVGDRGALRLFRGFNGALVGHGVAIALMGAAVVLWRRRDWILAGPGLFWLAWLATGVLLFSASNRAPAHYTEAYAPAIAVMGGVGAVEAWRARGAVASRVLPACLLALLALGAYAYRATPPMRPWVPLAALIGAAACLVSALPGRLLAAPWPARARALAVAALLAIPLMGSLWIAAAAPGGRRITLPNPMILARRGAEQPVRRSVPAEAVLAHGAGVLPDARYRFAISGINSAAEAIAYTGASVLPIWNAYQQVPVLEPRALEALIGAGDLPFVLLEDETVASGRLAPLEAVVEGACRPERAAGVGEGWALWRCASDGSGVSTPGSR